MDQYNLWHGSIHSYRKSLSSTTALSQVCDEIFTASEEREIASIIAVDESSAFDSINHDILIQKLRMYKLHEDTIAWIQDYISFRTQYVSIGAHDSIMKPTTMGIPQGSILGPILFNLYINDIPEIIKDKNTCQENVHQNNNELFGNTCRKCGNLSIYADDAVYTYSNKNRNKNQERLQEILERIKNYLNNHKMTMNPTKTLLWETMLKQKLCKLKGEPPKLITIDNKSNIKEVLPKKHDKCLGGIISNDLQWNAMIENSKEAILPELRRKLGILRHIASNIPQAGKQLLANGLILGKINYLISIYGGTQTKYLNKIQVIMNKTARFITGGSKREHTMKLMQNINWMTIRELVKYHTTIMAWKLVYLKTPRHMIENITIKQDNTLETTNPRLQNTKLGLRWRMVSNWNDTPTDIRNLQNIQRFKIKLKKWIKSMRSDIETDMEDENDETQENETYEEAEYEDTQEEEHQPQPRHLVHPPGL